MDVPAPTTPFHRAPSRLLAEWYSRERTLALTALVALACVPLLAALALHDTRTIGGIDVWIKPMKFHVAIAIYLGTLAWYAGWIDRRWTRRPWYRLYVAVIVASVAIELWWLSAAAAAGEPSHFNREHPLFAPLYPLMGVLAVTLTSATLFYAALIARHRLAALAPSLRVALVGGLVASFVLTVHIAGVLASMDSHWIGGTRSDATGLPVLGWSRDGGDLRVAHFFALHAMHFVPLAVWLASPFLPFVRSRVGAVSVVLGYALFVVATYRQALAGEPFL